MLKNKKLFLYSWRNLNYRRCLGRQGNWLLAGMSRRCQFYTYGIYSTLAISPPLPNNHPLGNQIPENLWHSLTGTTARVGELLGTNLKLGEPLPHEKRNPIFLLSTLDFLPINRHPIAS